MLGILLDRQASAVLTCRRSLLILVLPLGAHLDERHSSCPAPTLKECREQATHHHHCATSHCLHHWAIHHCHHHCALHHCHHHCTITAPPLPPQMRLQIFYAMYAYVFSGTITSPSLPPHFNDLYWKPTIKYTYMHVVVPFFYHIHPSIVH